MLQTMNGLLSLSVPRLASSLTGLSLGPAANLATLDLTSVRTVTGACSFANLGVRDLRGLHSLKTWCVCVCETAASVVSVSAVSFCLVRCCLARARFR